jgi:isopentenyl diphosphate isomerase/L-lactate dehydrogenase-like FMN-dependent dehydrogenase/thioredoxin reductase
VDQRCGIWVSGREIGVLGDAARSDDAAVDHAAVDHVGVNDVDAGTDTGDDADRVVDYLVIGGGPAGLQLGYFLHRAGRHYLILEAGPGPGTFFRTFPRHRQMISINKPHTGRLDPELTLRWDWNSLLSDDPELRFTKYTGRYFPQADDYVRYLSDFAMRHRLRIRCGSRVVEVAREPDPAGRGMFVVTDDAGRHYRARRVVVATGFTRPYVPEVPGIETAERYDEVSTDPDDFTDQRVLLIGKGNSAFETADNLTEKAAVIHVAGPSSIKFAWRTHFIGHLRAVNNSFLDTYQLKTQNSVLDCDIEKIEYDPDGIVGPPFTLNGSHGRYLVTVRYLRRDKTATFSYDRVIACTGFRMDASIFADTCRPELTIRNRFPALTHEWESVNVPDLYFAGTITQSRDFKKYTSAFIHGFRYGIRALMKIFDQRYEGTPWPSRELPVDPEILTDAVLSRLNRTSALWQQFHFMSDLVIVDQDVGHARYYEEVPVDYVRASEFASAQDAFVCTLEYGPGHDLIDPFDIAVGREWEAEHHHDDRYLHPVVRHYRKGELFADLRLAENLDNDWTYECEHREPLRSFVALQLAATTPDALDASDADPAGELAPDHEGDDEGERAGVPEFINLREVEPVARLRLDPVHYDYFAGGAQDEVTVRANIRAFKRLTLVPRILRGAGPPSLDVSVLGSDATMPVLLAPTAFHKLAYPEGELATARAAAAAGTIMVSAMLSTVAIEDIAAAARTVASDPQLWFQLYIQPDLAFTEAIVRRAEGAGCRALVVTVDSSALGRAERNDRNDFHDLPPDLTCENLRIGGRSGHVRQVVLSPELSWRQVDWLREISDLPILLKGVLHPADARIAVQHGIDGLVVSNHGGRQLDTAPATIDQLPAIVDAVAGAVPVLLDGGIRRGTDVVKALALGATAVAVGRPVVWGLAAGGEEGVARVLKILRTELAHTLTLCGVSTPADLDHDQVGTRPC